MALRPLGTSFAPTRKQINYLNKSFDDFKKSLIDYSKTYFPTSYTDFSDTSPGTIFIELASFVGDVLGFYLDSNFRESLLEHASEPSSVISIAQSLGYQPKPATAAITNVDLFQIVPAQGQTANYAPDSTFYLRLAPDAVFSTTAGTIVYFRTVDEVNFADPTDRETSVYAVDNNNKPTFYLIKKSIRVIAGTIKTYNVTFNSPVRFSKVVIPDTNVLDIISIIDETGNIWQQVDYLAQDLVLTNTINTNTANDPNFSVPPTYTLTVSRISRRFVVRYNENFECEISFGSGVLDDTDPSINLEPKKIANSEYQTNLGSTSLDPSDFLSSNSYGLAPVGTLTITYSTGGGIESNVSSNTITKIVSNTPLNDTSKFTPTQLQTWNLVLQSLAVNNPDSAVGGKGQDSVEEIRQNALAFFNAQNRLVTADDYVVRSYAMPPKYGGVSKVFVLKDEQINNILRSSQGFAPNSGIFVEDQPGAGVINLYALGYNQNKIPVPLNDDTKQNLKSYLDQYRMLTDTVRIMDAFVVNIGVRFKIIAFKNYNINEVLARCIDSVSNFFNIDNWQINQPIILADLMLQIASNDGVQSVIDLEVFNRYSFQDGPGYSNFIYDVSSATSNGVVYPSLDPMIWSLAYPANDIIAGAIQ